MWISSTDKDLGDRRCDEVDHRYEIGDVAVASGLGDVVADNAPKAVVGRAHEACDSGHGHFASQGHDRLFEKQFAQLKPLGFC